MTVETTESVAEFFPNGVTITFPLYFKFLADEDLEVIYIDAAGVSTTLVLNSGYVANGAGENSGWSVTTLSTLVGGKLVVTRKMEALQETDLRNQGRFFAETHEKVFDRLTMLIQQGFAWLARALVRPVGKDYYDAEGRRIANVGDPVLNGDATNKGWVVTYTAKWYAAAIDYAEKLLAGATGGFGYFIQLGAGAVARTFQSKLRDFHPSPLDYGAVGDGVADDTAAYALSDAASDVVHLPHGKVFNLSVGSIPAKPVVGSGQVKIGTALFNGPDLVYDIYRTSLYCVMPSYTEEIDFPTSGDNLTVWISAGSKRTGRANRSTFVSTMGPRQIINLDRCEGVGNGTLMFSKYAERTTAIGTIACQYLGCTDPAADGHGWWSNAGGFVPGQPGWDYQGMETRNPGIGAKIAAFNGYATQASDVGRSVGVGRNAFNGTVVARGSLAVGYRAGAGCFAVSNLSCIGSDAFRDGVFQFNGIAAGTFAGNSWQEGDRNAVFGYNAASATIRGSSNTLMGSFAGSDYTDLNDCILIGVGAGNNLGLTVLSAVLAIGPSTHAPLVSGRLGGFAAGINIQPADIKGTFHIKTSSYGPSLPAHTSGDDLIVENAVSCGITIRTPAESFGCLMFADPISPNVGAITYNHPNDMMTFRTGDQDRWRINSASLGPAADNAYSLGDASFRPSQLFAATSTIGLSDANLKDLRGDGELTAQELAAWARVRQVIFRFKDAIAEKGDAARMHAGHFAQQVQASFAAEGLNSANYALWCEDDIVTKVTRTRLSTRQKMVELEQPHSEIVIINGIPTQVSTLKTVFEPMFDHRQVVDEHGTPLTRMVPKDVNPKDVGPGEYPVGPDNKPVMIEVPVMHAVPVMEEFEEEYEAFEPNGKLLGLRYEQCLVFETAYLRTVCAGLDRRISVLEA